MSYVVYQVNTGITITDRASAKCTKIYRTEAAAQACKTRLVRKLGYQHHELAVCEYHNLPSRTRTVTNLMSGQPVEIDVNTPFCCDPSTETYWSA